MENLRRSKALSLLICSVLAILTILSCPRSVRLQKGKSQIAKIQMMELAGALRLFSMDVGRYPTTADGLDALLHNPGLASWRGAYTAKPEILKDPWDRPYVYRCPGQHSAFDLFSYGRDGVEGGEGENGDVTNREIAPTAKGQPKR